MKLSLPKIKITFLFILTLIIILISGRYKTFFIFYLLSFIHELGHVIMAFLFNYKTEYIEILPFGFLAKIDNFENGKTYKEFLIAIAGPLMFFLNLIVLKFLYQQGFLSFVALKHAKEANLLILIFNLLPIYPLDGSHIFNALIESVFTKKTAMKIFASLSIFCLLFFIIMTSSKPQWIIYTFLVVNQLVYLLSINRKWLLFIISRISKKGKYKIKVHTHKDLYRNKENYILNDDKIITELDFLKEHHL